MGKNRINEDDEYDELDDFEDSDGEDEDEDEDEEASSDPPKNPIVKHDRYQYTVVLKHGSMHEVSMDEPTVEEAWGTIAELTRKNEFIVFPEAAFDGESICGIEAGWGMDDDDDDEPEPVEVEVIPPKRGRKRPW